MRSRRSSYQDSVTRVRQWEQKDAQRLVDCLTCSAQQPPLPVSLLSFYFLKPKLLVQVEILAYLLEYFVAWISRLLPLASAHSSKTTHRTWTRRFGAVQMAIDGQNVASTIIHT